jgi:hypothetical protein
MDNDKLSRESRLINQVMREAYEVNLIPADLTDTDLAFASPNGRTKNRRLCRFKIVNGVKYQLHSTRGWKEYRSI